MSELPGRLVRRPTEPPVATAIDVSEFHLPKVLDARAVLLSAPASARAAAYRVLRHHLHEAGRPQIVAISSANPGEGKTTTALNLALALAETGRSRVLLAEANLRAPALAKLLGITPPWCFAEQVTAHRAQPAMPWSFTRPAGSALHIAALRPDLPPTQWTDAPAFLFAMQQLRTSGYDHIVVDAPSVLGTADVNLIQDAVDGVLLVVRARTTRGAHLRQAVEQLRPAKVLGTVLTDATLQ